ncbi:MAG: MarR family winged helix-turn-helix transcriptional regulator, partial [Gemmatimonadota bacterium]
ASEALGFWYPRKQGGAREAPGRERVASGAEIEDLIVASIRRIVRAVDLHSRHLVEEHGITAPQLAVLAEASRLGGSSIGALARGVHLSQPTVSGVLDRLERRGYVRRERSESDRRAVVVTATEKGEKVLCESPSLLQDRFREELARLEGWERHWLLSALERIAAMMDAERIKAAPVLDSGPIRTESGEIEPEIEEPP